MQIGPVEIKLTSKSGEEYKYQVRLSDISSIFHKIPGATDILDEVYNTNYNRYQLFDKMVKRNADLNTAVNKLAMLVQRAYKGFYIHPGDKEEEEETKFLDQVKKDAERLNIPSKFYAAARRLCVDGDVVLWRRVRAGELRWSFLPMSKMTAVRRRGDVGNPTEGMDMDINGELYPGPANYYVYAENGPGEAVYAKGSIIHIALNNEAEIVKDIIGRQTWGIWSHSPVESLRPDIYWALSSKVNDMIWRRLYLPREHHEVDVTDLMNLELYEGETEDERRTAAINKVTEVLANYVTGLKNQLPDQGYVTPKVGEVSAVTISIIEPKSTTYVSPNELLAQLSSTIAGSFYIHLPSETTSSFAAEHIIASDTQVAAEYLASIIKEALLADVKMMYKDNPHVEKLDIRLQLILPKDMESIIREAAVLRAAGVMPIDEIRVHTLGLDPLTDEQRKRLEEEQAMTRGGSSTQPGGDGGSQTGQTTQSPDQISGHFTDRDPDGEANRPETSESENSYRKLGLMLQMMRMMGMGDEKIEIVMQKIVESMGDGKD